METKDNGEHPMDFVVEKGKIPFSLLIEAEDTSETEVLCAWCEKEEGMGYCSRCTRTVCDYCQGDKISFYEENCPVDLTVPAPFRRGGFVCEECMTPNEISSIDITDIDGSFTPDDKCASN